MKSEVFHTNKKQQRQANRSDKLCWLNNLRPCLRVRIDLMFQLAPNLLYRLKMTSATINNER
jgi:hypothetical protein